MYLEMLLHATYLSPNQARIFLLVDLRDFFFSDLGIFFSALGSLKKKIKKL